MYPNQNTMSYPNQVQSQIAEQLLFQNQSSANIADIYKALDTVLSNMDIPNTAETVNMVRIMVLVRTCILHNSEHILMIFHIALKPIAFLIILCYNRIISILPYYSKERIK